MKPAFWDSSALVPLCVRQKPSPTVRRLLKQYQIVVWWATPIEMRSAFERLLRMGELNLPDHATAVRRLEKLRRSWREMQPSEPLRSQAEILLTNYSLKAADSLQLAAAWVWASGTPQACAFISGEAQLLEAARKLEFETVSVQAELRNGANPAPSYPDSEIWAWSEAQPPFLHNKNGIFAGSKSVSKRFRNR